MGLLYLPKLKKMKMFGTECFDKRTDVDLNAIKYKDKKKEKDRLQKIEKHQKKKEEKIAARKRKLNEIGIVDDRKKKKKKFQIRMSHRLREFKHYQKEEVLLKQLKKNYISQETF